jgi:hypothetical protein
VLAFISLVLVVLSGISRSDYAKLNQIEACNRFDSMICHFAAYSMALINTLEATNDLYHVSPCG